MVTDNVVQTQTMNIRIRIIPTHKIFAKMPESSIHHDKKPFQKGCSTHNCAHLLCIIINNILPLIKIYQLICVFVIHGWILLRILTMYHLVASCRFIYIYKLSKIASIPLCKCYFYNGGCIICLQNCPRQKDINYEKLRLLTKYDSSRLCSLTIVYGTPIRYLILIGNLIIFNKV